MKRVIKKNLVITAVMLSTLISFGNEIKVSSKDKVTNVSFTDVKDGSVLTIKDEMGVALYQETIKKSGAYSKGFDLTALPEGSYVIELEKDMNIMIVPFEVSKSSVTFKKEEKTVINKPVFIDKNKLVYVSKLTLNEKPVDVMIYNEAGKLIFSEKMGGTQSVQRIYDFSKSEKGEYRLVMSAEGRHFSEIVKI